MATPAEAAAGQAGLEAAVAGAASTPLGAAAARAGWTRMRWLQINPSSTHQQVSKLPSLR
eukprot:5175332-Prorocentrum_lima.AAC.1